MLAERLSVDQKRAVERLVSQVDDAKTEREPNSKHKIEYKIQNGLTVPQDDGYRELMSDRLFKKIAKKHAPWRLGAGQ